MTSVLQEVFIEIQEKLNSFSIKGMDIYKVQTNFDTKSVVEKDDFIIKYEEFWFEYITLTQLVTSINLTMSKMVELSPCVMLEAGTVQPYNPNAMQEYLNLWKLLLTDFYALRGLFISNNILSVSLLDKHYPEFHFCERLRSAFYQHPEIQNAYQNFGISFGWKNNSNTLPSVEFGPKSGGFPFYFNYHRDKTGLGSVSFEEGLKLNRQLLVGNRWDKLTEIERSQIKGWGLPRIDEKILAEEIKNLFNLNVFPHIEQKIKIAQSEGVA